MKVLDISITYKVNASIFNNHLQAAVNRMRTLLIDKNAYENTSPAKLTKAFAIFMGYEPPSKKYWRHFLVTLYVTGQLDHIKPTESKSKVQKRIKRQAIKKGLTPPKKKPKNTAFYESNEWQTLKKRILRLYGCQCMKCSKTNTEMHVDHIKPRSKYPKLELKAANLQVLCKQCNLDKSNLHSTDYRPDWSRRYNWEGF